MEAILDEQALIVLVNAVLVSLLLVVAGIWLAHGTLEVESPSRRQIVGEMVLSFFLGKAEGLAHGPKRDRTLQTVTALLASFFFFIVASNLIAMLPVPVVNRPPTSHFSVTLGLALTSVLATLGVAASVKGVGATIKHLFWPNPMQWISEITDVLSLSLRLFGNIAGEYMTVVLVVGVVPWGIPLILHALGLIPAVVQGLVFTLLTVSFLGAAIHEEQKAEEPAAEAAREPAPSRQPEPIGG